MIKILVCGDYVPQDRVSKLIYNENYALVFSEVKKFTTQADYSIVNLEAPVVETSAQPIEKCGPNLKCSARAIKALKYAGFDMVTLANNHFYDYGEEGVKQTLEACENESIAVVGGGMNITEAARIIYKEINSIKIAFINCCENEFSIATKTSAGSNPLNPIQQYYAIQEAKQKADKIIIIVHGGHEHYQLPSPRMKETYRFFIDAGADAVINHHQHCFSGYEVYKEKPIIYGLGNFSFDRPQFRGNIWNEGYMVMLIIDDNLSFEIIPYKQSDDNPGICILGFEDKQVFEQKVLMLNRIIADTELLRQKQEIMMEKCKINYQLLLQPYRSRFGKKLYAYGLAPSFVNTRKRLSLLNYFKCESHFERFLYAIKTMK